MRTTPQKGQYSTLEGYEFNSYAIAVPIITVRQEIFGDKNFRGFR